MIQNAIFLNYTTAVVAEPKPKFCQNRPTPDGLARKQQATWATMAGAVMLIVTNQPFYADVE